MDVGITKAQLKRIAPHYGCIDDDSGQVFLGFAGALSKVDGLYHGVMRYRPITEADKPSETNAGLPTFSLADALGSDNDNG